MQTHAFPRISPPETPDSFTGEASGVGYTFVLGSGAEPLCTVYCLLATCTARSLSVFCFLYSGDLHSAELLALAKQAAEPEAQRAAAHAQRHKAPAGAFPSNQKGGGKKQGQGAGHAQAK